MDVLILLAWFVVLLYLITRKWFWMTILALGAIALLFTPLASVITVLLLVAAGFVFLHIVFLTLMFVLSTLFIFS
jgi:hypothetical protein